MEEEICITLCGELYNVGKNKLLQDILKGDVVPITSTIILRTKERDEFILKTFAVNMDDPILYTVVDNLYDLCGRQANEGNLMLMSRLKKDIVERLIELEAIEEIELEDMMTDFRLD